MENNRNKTTYVFIVINVVTILFSVLFYIVYVNQFKLNFVDNTTSKNQGLIVTKTNKIIENTYNYINDNIEDSSMISDTLFTYGEIEDNTININGIIVDITDNYFHENNIGFIYGNLYVTNGNYFGYTSMSRILNESIQTLNSLELFVMDKEGMIYFNSDSELDYTQLSEYLADDSQIIFNDYLSKDEDGLIKTSNKDEKIYLTFTEIEFLPNLYILQSFSHSQLAISLKGTSTIIAIFLVLFNVIVAVSLSYIYISIHITNAELQTRRLKHYYAKPFIININRKGKIKSFNKKLKDFMLETKDYKVIDDLQIFNLDSSSQLHELVDREREVVLSIIDKKILFIPVSYPSGHYLIGTDVTNKQLSNINDELSVVGTLTKLDFDYSYLVNIKKHIDVSFVLISIKDYEDNVNSLSSFNQTIIRNSFTDSMKKSFECNLSDIYYISENKFIIRLDDIKSEATINKYITSFNEVMVKPINIGDKKLVIDSTIAILIMNSDELKEFNINNVIQVLDTTMTKTINQTNKNYSYYDIKVKNYYLQERRKYHKLKEAIDNRDFESRLDLIRNNSNDTTVAFVNRLYFPNTIHTDVNKIEYVSKEDRRTTELMLEQLLINHTYSAFRELDFKDSSILIKISNRMFIEEGYIERFLENYDKNVINGNSLILEIEEKIILNDSTNVLRKIALLKNHGIKICLSNYYLGFDLVDYFKDFGFDYLVFDKLFIKNINNPNEDRVIFSSLISIIRSLEIKTICRDVKDEKDIAALTKNRLYLIQGYYQDELSIAEINKLKLKK